jgi:Mce-associated membrane protein
MAEHAHPADGLTEDLDSNVDVADPKDSDDDGAEVDDHEIVAEPGSRRTGLATLVGVALLAAVTAMAGWLGVTTYQMRQVEQQRESFLQAARQGALNLTTIDWQEADTDVQRVLESAVGAFRDDFATRAPSFVDVVKKLQSKSVGSVAEAGVESMSDNDAQVLVTMLVKTQLPNQPEEAPRSWRLRIALQKSGDQDVKISNVVFVP